MARNEPYGRWRRVALQVVLWVVLGGVTAVAGWVSQHRQEALRPRLDEPREVEGMRVSLPERWQVTLGTKQSPQVVLRAREVAQGAGERPRVLTVLREDVAGMISPAEHLLSHAGRAYRVGSGEDAESTQRVVEFGGGHRGVMLSGARLVGEAGGGVWLKGEVMATAVLPDRTAVTVVLEGAEGPDEDLVEAVARSVEVAGLPPVREGMERVPLEGGVSVGVPAGYGVIDETDPNRVSRTLLLSDAAGAWRSVELIPLLVEGETESGVTLELMNVLSLHGWHGGTVKSEGSGRWRIESRGRGAFAERVHVVQGPARQAVLAVFRGGAGDEAGFDAAWEAIAGDVQFAEGSDTPALVRAGVEAMAEVRAAGLDELVEGEKGEAWWLWYRESRDRLMGWAHERHRRSASGSWAGLRRARLRLPDGAVLDSAETWLSKGGLLPYEGKVARVAHVEDRSVPVFQEELQATERSVRAKAQRGAEGSVAWTAEHPGNFVPGGWLPAVLGHLPARPMILSTEGLLGLDGGSPLGLAIVMVEPCDDVPADEAGGEGVLRCLRLRLNGSNESSRWYFRADGSLARVELADGIRWVRTEADKIPFYFDEESGLRPSDVAGELR